MIRRTDASVLISQAAIHNRLDEAAYTRPKALAADTVRKPTLASRKFMA